MLNKRVIKIKQNFLKKGLDGVFISSVSNIAYLTGYANFSKDEREAYLLIGKDFQYIITDGRYSEAIKNIVPHLTLFERNYTKSIEELFKSFKSKIKVLGIEEDNLTVSEARLVKKHFKKTRHFKVNRSVKTNEEIKKIEKACKLGGLAFEYILKKIKLGISEKEVALELENFIRNQKAETSFPSIVAFGRNCAIPHHSTSDKRLTINDKLILLDFGVRFENYCSDMTRTVFFGKPSKKQQEIYKAVYEAQQKAVDYIHSRKQVKAADVDKIARDYIKSKGYPNLPHSLGHGIGLEVHEHPYLSPKSKEELKEGMVFSIEPGIYIPDFGGVRIEDLYVLKGRELKRLTCTTKNLLSF